MERRTMTVASALLVLVGAAWASTVSVGRTLRWATVAPSRTTVPR